MGLLAGHVGLPSEKGNGMEQVTACLVRHNEAAQLLKWLAVQGRLGPVSAQELGDMAYQYAVEPSYEYVVREFNLLAEGQIQRWNGFLSDEPRHSLRTVVRTKEQEKADHNEARAKCIRLAELEDAVQFKRSGRRHTTGTSQRPATKPPQDRPVHDSQNAGVRSSALVHACHSLAKQILGMENSFPAQAVVDLADKFYAEATFHAEYITQQSRDPEIVVRAINYLCETYAIPPLGTDTLWFRHSLGCLIELAVPNSGLSDAAKGFLADVRQGLGVFTTD